MLLQYLLQQNRSLTGENQPASDGKEVKTCGWRLAFQNAPVDRLGPNDAVRHAGSDPRIERIRYRGVRARSHAGVPGRAGGGV